MGYDVGPKGYDAKGHKGYYRRAKGPRNHITPTNIVWFLLMIVKMRTKSSRASSNSRVETISCTANLCVSHYMLNALPPPWQRDDLLVRCAVA